MTLLVGHVTRKIVSEMTYNVWSGTLNSTIPYYLLQFVVNGKFNTAVLRIHYITIPSINLCRTGCLQLLEILVIYWNLKFLLEILEISWNLIAPPGNF